MTFLGKIVLTNLFVFFLFSIDRITKFFAFSLPKDELCLAETLVPQFAGQGVGGFFLSLKKFFCLELYKNYHLIFNFKIPTIFLYSLISLTLLILLIFLIKEYYAKNTFFIFCLSLIVVGAISNLIDRLLFGYVVDFLSFFDYSIFNLADVYIFAGVGLILIKLLNKSTKSKITNR
jgi:signal peptidase II